VDVDELVEVDGRRLVALVVPGEDGCGGRVGGVVVGDVDGAVAVGRDLGEGYMAVAVVEAHAISLVGVQAGQGQPPDVIHLVPNPLGVGLVGLRRRGHVRSQAADGLEEGREAGAFSAVADAVTVGIRRS